MSTQHSSVRATLRSAWQGCRSRMLAIGCTVTAGALAWAVLGGSGASAAPLPDKEAIKEAEALVKDVFKTDFEKAKTPGDQLTLAKTLMKQAEETKDDAASRYVLLREAGDLAAKAGEPELALSAVASIAKQFDDVKVNDLRIAVLERSSTSAKQPAAQKLVAESAVAASQEAMGDDDFDAAKKLLAIARTASAKARDVNVTRSILNATKDVEVLQKASAAVDEARKTLAGNPQDPAANLTMGKYVALVKGDWEAGLPMLAAGNDAKLAEVAKLEIAKPKDAAEQIKIADGWWDLAATQDVRTKPVVQARAIEWYELGVSGLSGLPKTRVEKRLKEFAEAAKAKTGGETKAAGKSKLAFSTPGMIGRTTLQDKDMGLVFKYVTGKVFQQGVVQEQVLKHGGEMKGIKVTMAGILRIPNDMTVLVWHAGGSPSGGVHRLFVDGRLLGEVGDDRTKNTTYKLPLTKGDHLVTWVLSGGDFGDSVAQFLTEDGKTPLEVVHTKEILTAAKALPTKSEVENSSDQRGPQFPP